MLRCRCKHPGPDVKVRSVCIAISFGIQPYGGLQYPVGRRVAFHPGGAMSKTRQK